jgi:hypothetical protein
MSDELNDRETMNNYEPPKEVSNDWKEITSTINLHDEQAPQSSLEREAVGGEAPNGFPKNTFASSGSLSRFLKNRGSSLEREAVGGNTQDVFFKNERNFLSQLINDIDQHKLSYDMSISLGELFVKYQLEQLKEPSPINLSHPGATPTVSYEQLNNSEINKVMKYYTMGMYIYEFLLKTGRS